MFGDLHQFVHAFPWVIAKIMRVPPDVVICLLPGGLRHFIEYAAELEFILYWLPGFPGAVKPAGG